MSTYIDLPRWDLHMPAFCLWVMAGMLVFLTFLGFLSVRKMLQGSAADALRPYTPRRMRSLPVERTRAFKRLSFGTKWNLRDSLRHPSRTLMTLLGIVGCMILLVGGLGMKDTMDAFIEDFYHQAIGYETRLNLEADASKNDAARELADELRGDWAAIESVQSGDEAVSLEIYSLPHSLVRFPSAGDGFATLTDDGAWICSRIAEKQGLSVGDSLVFSPYDSEDRYTVRVAGILRSMSLNIVMTETCAEAIGYPYRINTVFTRETTVSSGGMILNAQSRQAIMDSFDVFMQLMNVMILLLVVAAVVLGIVVLYNLGIMSYTERYREMATLKVLGFRDRRIGRLLISQNLWLTVLGILLGLPAGWAVLDYLLRALAGEYEMRLVIGPLTFLVSILLTFGVSLLVGVMVSRKNRHIDMVSALKTEE